MNTRLYFAPFHGLTTRGFRQVFFSHFSGIDAVLTPFLPAGEASILSEARFKDVLPLQQEPLPTIVQIIGQKKQEMIDTVLYLSDRGHERINWNIGCPMHQITRKKRGCGLMPFPDEIEQIVKSICKKTQVKFSIKMRLGMYHPNESLEIIHRLNKYPLDFICVHARLGTQLYDGIPDRDSFGKCFQQSKNLLCYNGDIFNPKDYHHLQQENPNINSYMLGRGMLKNPFLAEQIHGKEIPQAEQQKRFFAFYEDLTNMYFNTFTKKGALNKLKEMWYYFAVFCQLSPLQLQSLRQITDADYFLKKTKEILSLEK